MRVLLDTNVILDLLLDREPFARPATRLFSAVERGAACGLVCATSITTIFYLCRKDSGLSVARENVEALLSVLEVAAVNRVVLEEATKLALPDFEDAVIVAAAREADADAIVTRDARDFRGSPVPTYLPTDLLLLLDQRSR